MKYCVFAWSTAMDEGTAQGCIELPTLEAARAVYRALYDLSMDGKTETTFLELCPMNPDGTPGDSIYTAGFPLETE